jgi:hypothetical protein
MFGLRARGMLIHRLYAETLTALLIQCTDIKQHGSIALLPADDVGSLAITTGLSILTER